MESLKSYRAYSHFQSASDMQVCRGRLLEAFKGRPPESLLVIISCKVRSRKGSRSYQEQLLSVR